MKSMENPYFEETDKGCTSKAYLGIASCCIILISGSTIMINFKRLIWELFSIMVHS